MPEVTALASLADAEAMLAASQEQPVFVLKHSATCPVSAGAIAQFRALETDVPRFVVVVQTARPVSTFLAETLDVAHATPQAILVAGGRAVYVESHSAIRAATLQAAAAAHRA